MSLFFAYPKISAKSIEKCLYNCAIDLPSRDNARDEVVDCPANDCVVEHANIDIDNTDGISNTFQHRTDLLPE